MLSGSLTNVSESILILEPANYSPRALATYEKAGKVFKNGEATSTEITTLVIRLGQHISSDFLNGFPKLRWIVSPTTGLVHVDLEACRQRGIEVLSLKTEQEFLDRITSTSELTLGLMLALLRRIPEANRAVIEEGEWNRDRFKSQQCSSLTLGLIGFGRIGRHMARFAKALGMRTLIHDPFVSKEVWQKYNEQPASIDETLAAADIISIHADDRRTNWGMVNSQFLGRMKEGALLINTARGELLDEEAVIAALKSNKLAGVAVDVLAGEHVGDHLQKSALAQAARDGLNIIITPHIGGCSSDAMALTEEHMASRWLERVRA
jgi:D-3-phosphoglycerate dehydrogenase